MKIKPEILKNKVRNNNDLTLDLAKRLGVQQSAVFVRIDRDSKSFYNDIRVADFLIEQGFSNDEIFETESVAYKSLSNK